MKNTYRIIFVRAIFCFAFSSLLISNSFAQTPEQTVFVNRLCKTWKIDKMMNGNTNSTMDEALNEFRFIINADHTVQQGIYPEGMIKSTWTLDLKSLILTIKDDVTGIVYPMNIVSITADELVIEDQSANPPLKIYYTSK